jgi:hypothetical protein
MGLSNEERTNKIYFSIWRMTQLDKRRALEQTGYHAEEFKPLLELLDQLWPAFIGRGGNGLFWFLGSGVTNEVMDKPTLFSVAICGNKSRGEPDSLDQMVEKRREELEAQPDSPEKKAALEREDLFRYQADFHPTYEKILRRNAPALATVYEIYEDCENIRYALNRYRDEFAIGLKGLDDLVARILGWCFHLFTTDTRFREAWYTHQIANRAVYQRVDAESTVVKFWRDCNLHHDIGIEVHDIDELHDYWTKVQQKQTLTTEEAILASLWLAQRRFHYEHQFKSLVKLLKEHNKKHPKDKVSLAKVAKMFHTHNLPAHERYESQNSTPEGYCHLSQNSVPRDWTQNEKRPVKRRKKK